MKKTTLIVLCAFLGMTVYAQDLNEILENHFQAVGQEKITKVQTMTVTGKVLPQGMELPMKYIVKRPNKVRSEATIQGQSIITAYDGESGWMVNPMMGTTDPQNLPEMQVKQMKEQGDLDGILYNWEEKGHKLEYIGTDEMEGTEVYKLKLVKADGDEQIYFLDADSYLILKVLSKIDYQGSIMEMETYFSNYKEVDGIIIPFNIEIRMGEQTVNQIVMEEIVWDAEVDDAIFVRPEPAPKEEDQTEGEK